MIKFDCFRKYIVCESICCNVAFYQQMAIYSKWARHNCICLAKFQRMKSGTKNMYEYRRQEAGNMGIKRLSCRNFVMVLQTIKRKLKS